MPKQFSCCKNIRLQNTSIKTQGEKCLEYRGHTVTLELYLCWMGMHKVTFWLIYYLTHFLNFQKHSAIKKIIKALRWASERLGFLSKSVRLFDPYVCFSILILDNGHRKNIFPRVTLFGWWQVWKYLLLSYPISLVNKNDPGLMGPDAYIFWRQFLRKRVQNCDHKIRHESEYFFGMRRDVNKLLEPCFHIYLRFHT